MPRHRQNRFPKPPQRQGGTRAAPRPGTMVRLRAISHEHQRQERPFEPERRGSWRGSRRDLVVNSSRRYSSYDDAEQILDEHAGFRFYEDAKTKMMVMVDEDGRVIYIVNPLEVPQRKYAGIRGEKPYILSFGPIDSTRLFIWARSLDDALEEAGATLADHFPGLIEEEGSEQMQELYKEARDELLEEGEDEEDEEFEGKVWEQATADMTYTESGYITSYEWGIDSDPEGNEWTEAVEAGTFASKEAYEAEYGEEE